MSNKSSMEFTLLVSLIISIMLIAPPIYSAGSNIGYPSGRNNSINLPKLDITQGTAATEYWAVLFAVGIYRDDPDKNRPSMLQAVNNLYDVLIDSPQWQPDHIHMITGSDATGKNLIKELLWLIRSVDKNDMALVYITTHGSPLLDVNGHPVDLPPKDETDGADEILVMYDGFANPYAFIWDDLLNFLLSLLQSKGVGVCLIVDSCFSGGFNDAPFKATMTENYTTESFTKGLTEDVAAKGRVVLMSCEEDTYSYGSGFSNYLIDGFWGAADRSVFGNRDGTNSAEEAFYYAQPWVDSTGYQHPTILDLYPGEFPVTVTS